MTEKYKYHLGPSLCERLEAVLNLAEPYVQKEDELDYRHGWYRLPDGTDILIGTEFVYASTNRKPKPCDVDLGGDIPLTLWK